MWRIVPTLGMVGSLPPWVYASLYTLVGTPCLYMPSLLPVYTLVSTSRLGRHALLPAVLKKRGLLRRKEALLPP